MLNSLRNKLSVSLAILLFTTCVLAQSRGVREQKSSSYDILQYIHRSWGALQRSTLECDSLADPKLGMSSSAIVYVPKGVSVPRELSALDEKCGISVRRLPRKINHIGGATQREIGKPGLLFLPKPYVVPGGRFNEMYGWDSYFIIRGLVADRQRELARGMVEDFFFEIDNYGAVLNANRTYYLTRSQPPFLTSMILTVFQADVQAGKKDLPWLERAYEHAIRDHKLWTSGPKYDAGTGLSRYFDTGEGPVPEIGDHAHYYLDVADWLVKHPETKTDYLTRDGEKGAGAALRVPRCGEVACPKSDDVWLTPAFYKSDRAMRESGFDISFRFGPFSGSTQDYAPVCLNSLLFKAENDLAEIASILGKKKESADWHKKAEDRKKRIVKYLWSSKLGYFVDFNLRTKEQSAVLFASTFYPLWTGLATPEQAQRVIKQLSALEQAGGIAMSNHESGLQWDKPYGWAPIQLLAVEGIRRYGYKAVADRISRKFLTMVVQSWRKDGTIREKYNVINRSTDAVVTAGYSENVIGFGWTNGTFLALLQEFSLIEKKAIVDGDTPAR